MFPLPSIRLSGALVALAALSAAAVPPSATASEATGHTLSGDRVAIHNLAGDFSVVPTSGAIALETGSGNISLRRGR